MSGGGAICNTPISSNSSGSGAGDYDNFAMQADEQMAALENEESAQENFAPNDTLNCSVQNVALEEYLVQLRKHFTRRRRGKLQPQNVQIDFLRSEDREQMLRHCETWFPVHYPPEWYEAVTKFYSKYFSLGVFEETKDEISGRRKLLAFIVADIKPASTCLQEDLMIIKSDWSAETQLAYIMVIGVDEQYRRWGIASLLLQYLLEYLSSCVRNCRAVYLHVLASNDRACRFYDARGFKRMALLNGYYVIDGIHQDSFLYAMYIQDFCMGSSYSVSLPPTTLEICDRLGTEEEEEEDKQTASFFQIYAVHNNKVFRLLGRLIACCSYLSFIRRMKRYVRWLWRRLAMTTTKTNSSSPTNNKHGGGNGASVFSSNAALFPSESISVQ